MQGLRKYGIEVSTSLGILRHHNDFTVHAYLQRFVMKRQVSSATGLERDKGGNSLGGTRALAMCAQCPESTTIKRVSPLEVEEDRRCDAVR